MLNHVYAILVLARSYSIVRSRVTRVWGINLAGAITCYASKWGDTRVCSPTNSRVTRSRVLPYMWSVLYLITMSTSDPIYGAYAWPTGGTGATDLKTTKYVPRPVNQATFRPSAQSFRQRIGSQYTYVQFYFSADINNQVPALIMNNSLASLFRL